MFLTEGEFTAAVGQLTEARTAELNEKFNTLGRQQQVAILTLVQFDCYEGVDISDIGLVTESQIDNTDLQQTLNSLVELGIAERTNFDPQLKQHVLDPEGTRYRIPLSTTIYVFRNKLGYSDYQTRRVLGM